MCSSVLQQAEEQLWVVKHQYGFYGSQSFMLLPTHAVLNRVITFTVYIFLMTCPINKNGII